MSNVEGLKRADYISYKRSDFECNKMSNNHGKRMKNSGSRKRDNGHGTVEKTKNKQKPSLLKGLRMRF